MYDVKIADGQVHVTQNGVTKSLPLPTPPESADGAPQAVIDPASLTIIIQLVLQILQMFGVMKPLVGGS